MVKYQHIPFTSAVENMNIFQISRKYKKGSM